MPEPGGGRQKTASGHGFSLALDAPAHYDARQIRPFGSASDAVWCCGQPVE
jgi:hypothetical protein